MKRTVLSRRTPLTNRKPMRRTSGQTTRTTSLARRSRKRPATSAPTPDWAALREALYARAGGRCEHCGASLEDYGMDAHHRQLRSRGGGHTLDNLAALCPASHIQWAHGHPAEATRLGFVVASWEAPETVPLRLWDGRLVGLTETGGYVEMGGAV